MSVSIIIPTYNRSHLLKNIFDALALQTFTDFEVIVSCDGSDDNTSDLINHIKKSYTFEINLIINNHLGRANTRNSGAEQASKDILIFYDDDVRPNPKSIETHYNHHISYPKSICTGPAYYELNKLSTDFQIFRASMEHSWYPKRNSISRKAGMPGANWSIGKHTFNKIGKLDNRLIDSEDFEFSFRATHLCNIPIYFNLDTWVYHDDYKSLEQYLVRYILGNKSLFNLFKTNKSIEKFYWYKLYIKRNPIKSFFFSFFNTKQSVKVTNSSLFLVLPKKIRYKIYDFIITAQTKYFLNENFDSYKKH